MRAACELYEHPELSYSEIWAKDAYNRSGKTRMLATLGFFSIVALSTLAACQYTGLLDLRMLRLPLLLYHPGL
ncbi:hypothetical protein BDZ97DRAFT_789493 [Flammula alnicola]|nr:hypothetical protein BDZ97DRAFT_789493 [Flammula alnicola]